MSLGAAEACGEASVAGGLHKAPIRAFAATGIEIEYAIVDAATLDVAALAPALLAALGAPGAAVAGVPRDEGGESSLAWSNELVAHVVELKNPRPVRDLATLRAPWQHEVARAVSCAAALGARLMPTGMHPWMDPARETTLWPGDDAGIYGAYDRIFGCRGHGWSNLQAMHVNLPFAGDEEFARLHAAVRIVVAVLPALAASSPLAEGAASGFMDTRMEAYRHNSRRFPVIAGQVVPGNAMGRADYESRLLAPMYAAVAAHDPEGVLRHEWLNSHGAIARFDRDAIEIRVVDTQECVDADLAVAGAAVAAVRRLYDTGDAAAQRAIPTEVLARIFVDGVRDADRAVVEDAALLRCLGASAPCSALDLWRGLAARGTTPPQGALAAAFESILDEGPLARRIERALGRAAQRQAIENVYSRLCGCLETNSLFHAS